MGLLDRLAGNAARAEAAEARAAMYAANAELAQERLEEAGGTDWSAQAELALEDAGWQRMTQGATSEFSRAGIDRQALLGRIMMVANPLVKRGVSLRIGYVWAGGVSISARASGKNLDNPGEQDVNDVLQKWLDDPDTRRQLTGQAARQDLERTLASDGNLFIALWTSPRTGRVRPRVIPLEEAVDILTDPQDRATPWYYVRRWYETALDGRTRITRTVAHPAHDYRPEFRPQTIEWAGQGAIEVLWDAPILHVSVNGLTGWRYGVGDVYAALPWARSYKGFLEDWVRLVKALSQYAYRVKTKGSKAATVKTAVVARRPAAGSDASTAGATLVTNPDTTVEAVPKTGATIDSDSGRPVASMVAAALDVPVTMLLGDPGQTGARAVAETLDEPTRNAMTLRRALHGDWIKDIGAYVIREAVRAPGGALKGMVVRDGDREYVTLAADTDATIDVVWPEYDNVTVDVLMAAIKLADEVGVPRVTIIRLALEALGVDDIDSLMDKMTDDQGNLIPELDAVAPAPDQSQPEGVPA